MFWESAVQENNETIMDASYHMQCNSPSAGLGKLGSLNISNVAASSTLKEIATDHISFYDEEEAYAIALERSQNDDHLWHSDQLLLPEGPAHRFFVVEKTTNKSLQRTTLQRLQDATNAALNNTQNHHDNNNNRTPSDEMASRRRGDGVGGSGGSGFRVFNSLSSSCSMESSIDDEYLELFEMESLEDDLLQQEQSSLSFPSNLNSLISGQIKTTSLTMTEALRTPEMRRPSVRRCLSLNESNQIDKTPEQQQHQQQQRHQKNSDDDDEICTTPFSSKIAAANNVSPFSSAFSFKRPDPPSVSNSPIRTKRYRGDEKENFEFNFLTKSSSATITTTSSSSSTSSFSNSSSTSCSTSSRVPYRKSMSMNDAEIMSALARSDSLDEPDLIGDFSKPFILPLIEGQHRDLKTISSDTVARLINGEFDKQVANYVIVDCRYPYEYEGGHIRGAKNLYTQEQIMEEFLTQQKTEKNVNDAGGDGGAGAGGGGGGGVKRNIIIFHCEFSSKRGPRLSRFLRNIDRARNTNSYPTLDYPEIYLLHNGYKEFYETHSELCDPTAYRPMLEPAYTDAYRHFRAKSKSWNGDSDGLGGTTTRLKKSRSRLML